MEVTGLVLSGGKSTRMGSDKGLLLKDGNSWSRVVADQISALDIPFKISINTGQLTEYQTIFNNHELIEDQLDLPGPLRGILSAHIQYPEKNWLVLACDMIDMDKETLLGALNAINEEPGKEFYVYRNETHYEPFGGIYTASGLQKVYDMHSRGLLASYSLQNILRLCNTHGLLSQSNKSAFRNYNTL